jgi:hypothetical protein
MVNQVEAMEVVEMAAQVVDLEAPVAEAEAVVSKLAHQEEAE